MFYDPLKSTFTRDSYTDVSVAMMKFGNEPVWEDLGTAPAPPDGYSMENGRLVQFLDEGLVSNSTLYLSAGEESKPLIISDFGNTPSKAFGVGAVSTDKRWLAFLGRMESDLKGQDWPAPLAYVVDSLTGKVTGGVRSPEEGDYLLYRTRIVGPYFVAQYSRFEDLNWRVDVFDISNPTSIKLVIANQSLPGLIDDYNPETKEFLVRSESGLSTYRLFDGREIGSRSWGQDRPFVEGLQFPDESVDITVSSEDSTKTAVIDRYGKVRCSSDASDPSAKTETFYLDVGYGAEGSLFVQQAFFVPDSPYLCIGFGVRSDVSFRWECWDYERGVLAFGKAEINSEKLAQTNSEKLLGLSPDGQFLIFDTEPWKVGTGEVKEIIAHRIQFPQPIDIESLEALVELCSGARWTASGIEQLDFDGRFANREKLLSEDKPANAFGEWLNPWVDFIRN